MTGSGQSHTPPASDTSHSFTPRQEFLSHSVFSSSSTSPTQRHTFALLTLASTSVVRLYSFTPPLVSSIRSLFSSQNLIHAVREDAEHMMIEFTLHGKLWNQHKSPATERLIVEILAAVYENDWTFVSTLDYGREHDDRLAIAFRQQQQHSTPVNHNNNNNNNGNNALNTTIHPLKAATASMTRTMTTATAVASTPVTDKLVPFAISFPNATSLRVISPPLHLTPAILASVRGSWPRGVVSEKKVSDGVYEFRLKGYQWFQEDTFATDSLYHILTLLSTLDSHAFTLLASLCLSNGRSRVKDFWVFTGPKSSESPSASTYAQSGGLGSSSMINVGQHRRMQSSPTPGKHSTIPLTPVSSNGTHKRAATDPDPHPQSNLLAHHPYPHTPPPHYHNHNHNHNGVSKPLVSPPVPSPSSLSSSPPPPPPPLPGSVLRKPSPRVQASPASNGTSGNTPPILHPEFPTPRKPAPRAQVPVSIIDGDGDEQEPAPPGIRDLDLPPFGSPTRPEYFVGAGGGIRVTLPSEVPDGVENMTGVGSAKCSPDAYYAHPETPTRFGGGGGGSRRDSVEDSFYRGGKPRRRPRRPSDDDESLDEEDEEREEEEEEGSRDEEEEIITNLLHPNAFDPRALSTCSHSPEHSPPAADSYPDAYRLHQHDSYAESESDASIPIPITWTGPPLKGSLDPSSSSSSTPPADPRASSATTPFFPGAWSSSSSAAASTPTPSSAKDIPKLERVRPPTSAAERASLSTPILENSDLMMSPKIEELPKGRKSQAGIVVTLEGGEWKAASAKVPYSEDNAHTPTSSHPPPLPPLPSQSAQSEGGTGPNKLKKIQGGQGQGWVYVDMEGKQKQIQTPTETESDAQTPTAEKATVLLPVSSRPTTAPTKAADGIEKELSQSSMGTTSPPLSYARERERLGPRRMNSGRVRRFLSLSRRGSTDGDSDGQKKDKVPSSPGGFRSKLRRLGGS